MRADEWRERRALLAGRLEEWKLDALLVTHPPNVRYLTGFTGSNGMLLLHRGGAILFTDPRYRVQAGREVSCRVKVAKGSLLTDVMAAVARLKAWRLGFERSHVKFETYDFLKSRLPMKASLEPVPGRIEQQRMIKSAAEIAAIRASVETNSKAFEQAVRRATPGMRESELAAEIEHRMRRLGAEKPAFETIVAAGVNSALPHARPGNSPLRGLVVVDMGVMQNGYTSDMTRMLFAGRLGRKAKQLYEAVLEAQLAALAAVRAGVPAATVDRAARRVLGRHKLARAFVHSTGHGLGLEIHEAPRLGKTESLELAENMVVTVEPGAYLEGFGGVRIEDTVVVTATGCEILTPTGKELRVI